MRLIAITSLLALLVDQASKYLVIFQMELWRLRVIDVAPPFLNFHYGENTGINFGLGENLGPWVLIGLALLVCLGILAWMWRVPQPRIVLVCAGLLIGGALGNVVDRIVYGYVLDFINNSCCGFQNPFVYNVADIFIFLGAIGIVFLSHDAPKGKKGA